MKMTSYFVGARVMPAVICSIPFFVLYFFFLRTYIGDFSEALFSVKWVGDVSTMAAFTVLMAALGRAISKDVFEKYWFSDDGSRMPTTDFLLHVGTEYSDSFRMKLHAKIRKDFSIEIPGRVEEQEDVARSRKIIAEAVGQIRHKLKDGRLILQHNIEYGFVRNLAGGSVIAFSVSLLNVFVFSSVSLQETALFLSIGCAFLFAAPILLSKVLVANHGLRYARILFQEYLATH